MKNTYRKIIADNNIGYVLDKPITTYERANMPE
jgi:hypothetical protein